MNKLAKNPGKGKKRKSNSLEQKIDAAQKRKAKLRASATLPPMTVSPSAAIAAKIMAAPARRSVAVTSAPWKFLMPWIVAFLPSISTSAPILRNSSMYW